ncbi:response regulator receiver protein [Mycolicibacterium phlei]|uniref:hypothetical protein n=1 Tax=Mycobacteroides chelonae TaxID=1774 RepID=UPI000618A4D7|nr:hypothetical protein [Mycobacteroides chelonae]VEG17807.1 response regulator receiver protein [Mycolicibacterium phlei]AKC39453.1 hypothetical protein GR01_14035 [Mycobacteroides chelonae]ANA98918.1 hypothetical protein BB28_14870 [Mycobacteroides chelonae CCUG 47445]OLT72660.1 hypothetical protein BKG56_21965 [Mycobacteroides chelonae]ORV11988.1 hypothetical protein AWB96_21890 [Mycobacteroides chelonae]
MTSNHDPFVLRSTMRADLSVAMKTRDSLAVSALRTAIAAIDNAESVDGATQTVQNNTHIASAASGLGSAEAARKVLSPADVRAILHAQIEDRATEAARYDVLGQAEAAAQLREEAAIIAGYL